MWYTYTMEYYSAIKRNEIGSFVETWMDLESVIQSEVSQKEKQIPCINACMWNLEKSGTHEPICRAGIETQMQNMDVWMWSGGRMNWEIETDEDILPSVKQTASGNLLGSTESSAQPV